MIELAIVCKNSLSSLITKRYTFTKLHLVSSGFLGRFDVIKWLYNSVLRFSLTAALLYFFLTATLNLAISYVASSITSSRIYGKLRCKDIFSFD